MEMVNPLPAGPDEEVPELFLKSKLVGLHAKGKNGLSTTEAVLVDGSGKVYYRFVSAAMMVGAKGFKDSGVNHSKTVVVPKRAPDKVVEQATSCLATRTETLSRRTHSRRLSKPARCECILRTGRVLQHCALRCTAAHVITLQSRRRKL